jgi:hypothetical protein
MEFFVQTKQEWQTGFAAFEEKLKHDPYADPEPSCNVWGYEHGCKLFPWNDRYTAYTKQKNYTFGSESNVINTASKTINGLPFLIVADEWLGGCSLHYVTFQKNTDIEFSTNICHFDLPFLFGAGGEEPDPRLSQEEQIKQAAQRQKDRKAWISDIVKGATTDPFVMTKQAALLKVISTLKIQ